MPMLGVHKRQQSDLHKLSSFLQRTAKKAANLLRNFWRALCFKVKMDDSFKVVLLQLFLVLAYFPLYEFHVWAALIYAGVFTLLDLRFWPGAIRKHAKDTHFSYLIVTVVTSFIAVVFLFANIYEVIGTVATTCTKEYITGLWEHVYFSVVTFTTLGYGEYTPQGYAKIATSIQAILGLGYFAFIVGVCSALFYARFQKK
jgi:uncharacterized membrane protein